MLTEIAFLCCVSVVAQARGIHGVAQVDTGSSTRSLRQNGHGNYAFGYEIVDAKGSSNGRSETGDDFGNKKGTYTLHDIDGRARRVDYVADKYGFRAIIKTNEPGTAASSPAATFIDSPYEAPVDPISEEHTLAVAGTSSYGNRASSYRSNRDNSDDSYRSGLDNSDGSYSSGLDNSDGSYSSGLDNSDGSYRSGLDESGGSYRSGFDNSAGSYRNGLDSGAGYGNRLSRSARTGHVHDHSDNIGYQDDLENDFGSGKGYDDGLGYGLSGHY